MSKITLINDLNLNMTVLLRKKSQNILVLFLLFGLGTAAICLYFVNTKTPFFFSFLTLFLLLLLAAFIVSKTWVRLVAINVAAVFFAFGACEGWLMLKYDAAAQGNAAKKNNFEGTYLQGYFNRKGSVAKILGYGPRKGFKATSKKISDSNELIYDVSYTINNNGLRVTPSHYPNAQCALFFGCSVTFGEGVEDSESYPYQVGKQSMGRIQTYNFGFHGYGPHQMLAALESGLVDSVISCKPAHVVYLGTSSHINRLLGLSAWDPNGPWYVLDGAGSAKLIGRFSDPNFIEPPIPPLEPEWRKYLSSHWHTFHKVFGPWLPFNEQSIRLYLAVIRKARDTAAHDYPGVNFHIVLWDVGRHKKFAKVIEDELKDEDIHVHRISEIIPDYKAKKEHYKIKLDGHPTPIVYKKIAKYLTEEFLSVSK